VEAVALKDKQAITTAIFVFYQPGLTKRDKWFCRTLFLSLTKGPSGVPTLFFLFLGISGGGLATVFCI
jgi:hypothetical protein